MRRQNHAKGNRRTFSIVSPPQETGRLLIATRMTGSALKRSLAELALGTPVEILGPSGFFTHRERLIAQNATTRIFSNEKQCNCGDGAIGAGVNEVTSGGTVDVVVVDNFIYGEPQAAF